MAEIDPRIVQLGIETGGRLKVYEGLAIKASGTKYANPLENDCTIEVFNLDRETRDYILTETSPYNPQRTRKKLTLSAGRQGMGVFPVFAGDITGATVSQPPDIGLTLKARTGFFDKGDLVSRALPTCNLSTICKGVAKDLGLKLVMEAKDKKIANWSFTGGKSQQVEKLASSGRVDAFIDDDVLVVKDISAPLKGVTHVLSEESGMVGIPEITEHGIKVTMLLVPGVKLGGNFTLNSKLYKAINGDYTIYKLSFEITSRDIPFYWVAECRNRKKAMIRAGKGALLA